jgi:hypothetical protein
MYELKLVPFKAKILYGPKLVPFKAGEGKGQTSSSDVTLANGACGASGRCASIRAGETRWQKQIATLA